MASTTTSAVRGGATRWRRRREIARGGTSVLYEVDDAVTGQTVALKVLLPEIAADPQHRARLVREARALRVIRHPGVVRAFDAGEDEDGAPWLALEMLEGRGLDALLTMRRKLPVDQTLAVGIRLCDALRAVHEAGVLHRDVKPGNVLLVREDGLETIKLLDFGIASSPGGAPEGRPDPKLTAANAILGTPDYMAPEQLFDLTQVDARTDVFAVGVSLFECLTGEVPFPSTYPQVLARALAKAPLAHERREDVPTALSAVLARAMAADPDDRFQTAAELGLALLEVSGRAVPALALLDGGAEARSASGLLDASHRAHVRVPFVTPARIVLAGGAVLDGRTVDVSEGGTLVMTDQVVEGGRTGVVRFTPPDLPIAEVQVEARWVRDGRGRQAIGLKFVDLAEPVRAAIARYVAVLEKLEGR